MSEKDKEDDVWIKETFGVSRKDLEIMLADISGGKDIVSFLSSLYWDNIDKIAGEE